MAILFWCNMLSIHIQYTMTNTSDLPNLNLGRRKFNDRFKKKVPLIIRYQIMDWIYLPLEYLKISDDVEHIWWEL